MTHAPSVITLNLEKCIFCRKDLPRSKLVGPGDFKRSDIGLGYEKLADTVQGFRELNLLLPGVDFSCWDEGNGIKSTCSQHKVC
jgi:hypothetical protein